MYLLFGPRTETNLMFLEGYIKLGCSTTSGIFNNWEPVGTIVISIGNLLRMQLSIFSCINWI